MRHDYFKQLVFFLNLGQGHHLPKSERCAHTPMGVCVRRGGGGYSHSGL